MASWNVHECPTIAQTKLYYEISHLQTCFYYGPASRRLSTAAPCSSLKSKSNEPGSSGLCPGTWDIWPSKGRDRAMAHHVLDLGALVVAPLAVEAHEMV